MKLDTALYQLRTFPLTFLQNNLLHLSGSSLSGERLSYFCRYDAADGVNEGFSMEPSPGLVKSIGSNTDTYKTVSVHNLRMIPRSEGVDPASIEPYILDTSGSDIMITGQLNACTLAVRQEVGQLVVAHIQPAGKSNTHHDMSGYSGQEQLAQRLANRNQAQQANMMSRKVQTEHDVARAKRELGTETGLMKGWMQQAVKIAGQFQGHGRVTHTFGPADYGTAAYVVGVRTAGAWHLYGQRVAGVRGPIQGVTQII